MTYANLHPSVEISLRRWLANQTTPAFLLVGPPGVGKTTLAREILKQETYRIIELNASHTRSGQAFKKQIIPLLTQKSVLEVMSPSANNKLAVLLDEIDGLSLGEKGGLNELLDYMRYWKPGNVGHPLILICNEIKGRAYQYIVRLSTYMPMEFPSQTIKDWLGHSIEPEVLASADLRVILRAIDGRRQRHLNYEPQNEVIVSDGAEEEGEEPSTEILKYSHSCLYEIWDPFIIPNVENNLGNLSGLCVHENMHDRLSGVDGAWPIYKKFMHIFYISDKADYWAFFYQNWNLLKPSFQLKLKIVNAFLSEFPSQSVPPISSLQFTQVLTRQSSMYNTWKQMIQYSDQHNISIESVPRHISNTRTVGLPANLAKKIQSMNIPKHLCEY